MADTAAVRRATKPKPMERPIRRKITAARQVSLADARNHLTTLVRDVEHGLRVELTRRGRPVAVLVSHQEYERMAPNARSIAAILDAWHASLPSDFEGFTAKEVASWRDRSAGRAPVRFGS